MTELNEKYPATYSRAKQIRYNLEPRRNLYFDPRYWSNTSVRDFFHILQREDNDTWCYFTNKFSRLRYKKR